MNTNNTLKKFTLHKIAVVIYFISMSFNSLTPTHTPYKNVRILSASSVNVLLLKNNKRLCLQTMVTKFKKNQSQYSSCFYRCIGFIPLTDRIHYDNFHDIHKKFVLYCGLSVVYKKVTYQQIK